MIEFDKSFITLKLVTQVLSHITNYFIKLYQSEIRFFY